MDVEAPVEPLPPVNPDPPDPPAPPDPPDDPVTPGVKRRMETEYIPSSPSKKTNKSAESEGWGCGYRTLQTICSWMTFNLGNCSKVPTVKEIQEILVQLGDKPQSFIGSKQWIGSFEVCLVIDKLYDVPCKILHVNKGDHLSTIVNTLVDHFNKFGSPVMMGGDVDCSSKGIMGIDTRGSEPRLLVVDPHYVGKEKSKEFLQDNGWVKWQPLTDFLSSSFYNLCLPQTKAKSKDL